MRQDIRQEVWPVGCLKKKGTYKKNDSWRWAYLPEDPVFWSASNLAQGVASRTSSPMTVFLAVGLGGFDSVRGQILPFSYLQAVGVNTKPVMTQPVMTIGECRR